ncbi:hypothetical protein H112_03554 [Trichophyton rubrum D6]|uniref:Ubiquitin-like domain-containing protein n=3 Tax=Trichophyton rubrum TaxID=5551 RepID=A0A178EYQ0_TRIRU|nr:uncharacterized protein TERG_04879 [Trichophyton rubrum CBS 118892]EZF23774.1 hypothetical protein H100_03560 [Trichophyton rubrum MR850]EZF42840.1 hypothetical protein H102_03553 [Trichophyton rubrum CBS 100081]EZF53469.1 hypothetical protein H103_03563 [Trichophyton rubrum CBS 288.86]EZF64087.1 hypothetical protein H104_03550 [Trichophyton rubrum CBS 289.86]EZF85454.1 hypothetical protein H110_03561 [Trichophyton rubrum MR1448]EZF96231.1 hypothetical protein H113_03581 [Trichophyton rubr
MAAGFGFSVGDFIACTKVAKSVYLAFREGTGASSTYQRVVADLNGLLCGLEEIRCLEFDESQKHQKLALQEAADQCQQTIETFLLQHAKFKASLGKEHTASKFKTRFHKVEWALFMKSEVDNLRTQILGHTTTINTLLITMQSSTAALQISNIKDYSQATLEQSALLMKETQNRIGQTHNMLGTQADTLSRILNILEVPNTQPNIRDVRLVMMEAFDMNMKVYRMALDLQKSQAQPHVDYEAPALPPQIERQRPVELEDAHGRVTPFHVEFINSFEALQAVLEARFRNVPGWKKVKNMEYVMKESNSKRQLNFKAPWESVFLPGRSVTMSMVFWMPPPSGLRCLGCQLESQESATGYEVQCQGPNCKLWYERVVDLEKPAWNTSSRPFDIYPPRPEPIWPPKTEDAIHDFRRVQVRHTIAF